MRSGLTASEFASWAGINAHTLTYWKWRLSRSTEAAARPNAGHGVPSFVEIVAPVATSSAGSTVKPLEVVLPGNVVVRVPSDFDVSTLRRVVDALGGRS